MIRTRWLVIGWLALAAAGCAERSTGPVPPPPPPPPPPPAGSAVVSLTTPHGDDGAIAVTVRGPGLSNLASAASGYLFYSRLAGDSVARVIVVGNVAAGPLLTFKPADGAALSAYRATIDEVATRGDAVRPSLTSYALTITAAP